jgi:CheY-like chemotaxis protein
MGNEHRATNGARRILLVEDNTDQAEMMVMLLEFRGHEVTVAPDGPGAIERAESYRPDLILLDLGLPDMDGYEVARQLRRIPGLAHTPLVALTGYGQQKDRNRTAEAGFAYHLVKPVDPDLLERVVNEVTTEGSED